MEEKKRNGDETHHRYVSLRMSRRESGVQLLAQINLSMLSLSYLSMSNIVVDHWATNVMHHGLEAI